MKKIRQIKKKNLYILFYCLALLSLAIFFHYDYVLNPDEGVTLNGTWNIYSGRWLYVDFFAFIPPLSFYLIAWLWKIFGVSFLAVKILSIILLALSAFGLYKIAEKLKPSSLNLWIPFLFIFISSWFWLINHNFFQLFFMIWSSYFFISYLLKDHRLFLILAGLLSGLSLITLQQKGFIFCLCAAIFLLIVSEKKHIKKTLIDITIYTVGAFIPVLFLFLFWSPVILYNNLIDFPLFHYIEANHISYVLLMVAVFSLITFIFSLRHFSRAQKFLLFIVVGLVVSCYPLPDYYHLNIALILLLPLLPGLTMKLTGIRRYSRIIVIICLVWLWCWPVMIFFSSFNGSFIHRRDYLFLEFIRHECPGKYLHVGPFLPNIYPETRKLSATSFDILMTGHQTSAQFQVARLQLEASRPACVVTFFPSSLKRFKYQPDNLVDSFIKDNYRPVYHENSITVWRYQGD